MMVNIIVTGHGEFSSGLLTALKLIAGEQPNIVAVNFLEMDTTEALNKKLKAQIEQGGQEIIVLADLLGGSPFKESLLLKMEFSDKNIEVLSGTNFPMLLSAALTDSDNANELARELVDEGKNAVSMFEQGGVKIGKSDDEEDGI